MRSGPSLLRPSDTLPRHLRRVAVAGAPGAGKSTLVRNIAERADLPYRELDSFFHGPGWTVRPTWVSEVLDHLQAERWAIEWQGQPVLAAMSARADLLVWLDHPRWLTTLRVVRRTLRRRRESTVLWAGNVEPPLRSILRDPEHIIRHSWRRQPEVRSRVRRTIAAHPDLPVVRLRGQRQVDAWLAGPLAAALAER